MTSYQAGVSPHLSCLPLKIHDINDKTSTTYDSSNDFGPDISNLLGSLERSKLGLKSDSMDGMTAGFLVLWEELLGVDDTCRDAVLGHKSGIMAFERTWHAKRSAILFANLALGDAMLY